MQIDPTSPEQLAAHLEIPLVCEEPMSKHTTFQIGGPAEYFFTVSKRAQLSPLLAGLALLHISHCFLGNGSNLLVSDSGIAGAVIELIGEWKSIWPTGPCSFAAGAGATLAKVCAYAREHGLTGLEFAWGIPGSVGGAAYMNAGAYGGEMREVITCVTHLSSRGEPGECRGEDLKFAYRKSRYTGKTDCITTVEFTCTPGEPGEIAEKMEELMRRRKEKQPYEMPSAGSIFKRPAQGFAAALIEECGLKGRTVGGAQVSPKHAGFIVNLGGATCQDVCDLIQVIQQEVQEKKGVQLECEVRITGGR